MHACAFVLAMALLGGTFGLKSHSQHDTHAHMHHQVDDESEISKFMKHLNVIPDVIATGPADFLNITFDSGVKADKGVELTPTQVKNEPKVEWESKPDTLYTLIMIDPDAPSRENPTLRHWLHWMVVNKSDSEASSGDTIAAYIGAGPPPDTGLHRYIILLFEQKETLNYDGARQSNTEANGRMKFDLHAFMQQYDLKLLAGNFFQAQYDDYVPVLYKQLGQ